MKALAIDFEFNRVEEPNVHPVCVSFQQCEVGVGSFELIGEVEEFWLDRTGDPDAKLAPIREDARARLKELLVEEGLPILAHSAPSEYRALQALQLAMRGQVEIKALCTHTLQRQLTHTYPPCVWGRKLSKDQYTKENILITTTPPSYVDGEDEPVKDGKPHGRVETSLAEALAHHLGVIVDTDHKTLMRNKIIAAPKTWAAADKKFVQAYCSSDIQYLPALFAAQLKCFQEATNMDEEFLLRACLIHGQYMLCVADRENVGTPVFMDGFHNLVRNTDTALDSMITDLVQNQYPFYVREKKVQGELKRAWVRKQSRFNDFLKEKELYDKWPVSPKTLMPKMDNDTLEEYDSVPEIYALRQMLKTKQNLGFFQASHSGDMLSRIGTDGRVRSYPHPYGTQTGRDAPKPSTGFVLNMAKWLRWLNQAPEGYCLIGADWVSEEFILAGALSHDQNMIDIYNAGDVYMGFGARGGLVPEGATKKTHGVERQTICKPVILGQQFGLGVEKQRVSLSIAQGREVSWEESAALRDLHKELFPDLWRYKAEKLDEYKKYGSLIGPDGWCLLPGQDRALSVQNWPIQSMGGVIMRKANYIARGRMADTYATHHDALYALARTEDAQKYSDVIEDSMKEAVGHYLPDIEIRRDVKILQAGEGLLEEDDARVVGMFNKMKKYFNPMETEQDYVDRVLMEVKKFPTIPIDMELV